MSQNHFNSYFLATAFRTYPLGLVLFFAAFFTPPSALGHSSACPVPLRLDNGVPIVSLTINGMGPFSFIVDTGTSSDAIVSPQLARSLRLPMADQIVMTDLSGRDRSLVDQVEIQSLIIADRQFTAVRALIHEPIANRVPYDGILGFHLFRNLLLTLDFPRSCMALADGSGLDQHNLNVLPLDSSRHIPVVALNIGDSRVWALIDSGGAGLRFSSTMLAGTGFIPGTEFLEVARTQTQSYRLIGGEWMGEFRLGSHNFRNPYIEVAPVLRDAILGVDALRDFAITFDQQQNLVSFEAKTSHHRIALPQSHLVNAARVTPLNAVY